ncbi:hypothetical protein ZTR_04653 [Talaromyces verruculosus]|nr:hypothetical protein ZTR_04653 [Talaromyces verruculosus]
MWLGYKDSLTLDMLSELDPKMSAKSTSQRFSAGWKRASRTWDVIAYVVVYVGIALSTGAYMYFTTKFVTLIRGGLIGLLFEKALEPCVITGNITATMANKWLKLWLGAIEKRVDLTTRIVNQFRSVKMAGLSKLLASKVSWFREDEIRVSKTYRTYIVGIFSLTYVSNTIAPVLGFTIFVLSKIVHGSRVLDSTRAFSALTVFSLLTQAKYLVDEEQSEQNNVPKPVEQHEEGSEQSPQSYETSPNFELAGLSSSPSHDTLADLSADQTIVIAKKASIGWDNERAIILNATFTINQGSLTVIQGDTASGKSTLVKALLGVTVVQRGSFTSRFPNAGYSSQEPWLMKGTVRENVVGPSKFDGKWYEMVLDCCALNIDISRMGQGDQTLIGGEGIRLSGGQQSRLALARAVYSRHEVMIFDDIFSALDPATMGTIMTKLFAQNGLFRRLKTSVIIVSNNASLAQLANSILKITSDGRIDETINEPTPMADHSLQVSGSDFSFNAFTPTLSLRAGKPQYTNSAVTALPAVDENSETKNADKGNKKEKRNEKVYRYYFKAAGRRNIAAFLACVVGLVFGLYFPQILISWWATPGDTSHRWGDGVYLGVYFSLGIFSLICIGSGGLILMLLIVANSASKLHASMIRTLFRAPVLWILQRDDGDVINRFSQDLGLVDAVIPLSSFVTVFSGLTCIIQAIFICVSSKYLVIVVVGSIFVLYIVQIFYLRTSRQLRILDLEATAPLVSQVLEALQGNITIKALGWESAFRERQLELLDQSQKPYYLLPMVQRWLGFVLDLIVAGIAVVLVSLTVMVRGSATTTFLGAGLTGIINFALNMNFLIQNWTVLETAIQAIWRIKLFCEDTPSEEMESSIEPPPNWPSAGKVSFRNVYASYVAGAMDVLENITFDVEPSQKIGICGRTGSGKSSMLSALSKILQTSRGSITVDGMDLKWISPDTLREKILTLPQNAVLVPGDIRENVDPSGTLSDAECISFLEKVGLWEFLERQGGLDAPANEQSLSAGQGQLLVLARALAHPSPIMMMDEITSSLDEKTDNFIRDLIKENFQNNTIISVAHRLEHLLECDKVVVIHNGCLQEYDDPRVLLDKPDSHFRALFF